VENKIITEQEAIEASIEYFDGDSLAADVFIKKYALRDDKSNLIEKTPKDMHRRIAKEFATDS
jgi:ribonucleoside-diphosphate reductase alpha chain